MFRIHFLYLLIAPFLLGTCAGDRDPSSVREMVDTVGFANEAWQMDSIMSRLDRHSHSTASPFKPLPEVSQTCWKTAICPHDDYSYAGPVYTRVLPAVKAHTIILIGVAHRADELGLKGRLVFDDYDYWSAPYGQVETSPLRDEIIKQLPEKSYLVHRRMHQIEHSLEALIPFLQYYHPGKIEMIPILVPAMPYQTMEEFAPVLAGAIGRTMRKQGHQWGKDYSLVISTDAVHYGDKGWGGKNFARYGTDSLGYHRALAHEHQLMRQSFEGKLKPENASHFYHSTVSDTNYTQYQWTWCGRYSVPFGMLTSYYLNQSLSNEPLKGHILEYSTSISYPPLKVDDINMGHTAPAHPRHWVGYAAVGYR